MLRAALIAISGLALAGCSVPSDEVETPETEVTDLGDGLTIEGPTETAAQLASDEVLAKYIPWDADADNVQTTASGVQYIVVREGEEGGLVPGPRDRVTVRYDGRLVDGTRFDSSHSRDTTASFGVDGVISLCVGGVTAVHRRCGCFIVSRAATAAADCAPSAWLPWGVSTPSGWR